ncbi:phosphonate metabolism protein/1,5-bisphosphokinase (PRPP-forming) PhnN [uncultured Aquitalea sp.]|uniref:phosphonate metabolism protein/1,5-bisphosphokinase (PRPP-forming) PhnN n=1 Tax=uncultured Aquitalea sp. TaxID=540272 RepID=UPI0025F4836F|nr:phosphonate metabolism protein/1,5-bisphosphokinase (PRPP-forming) PhnN [uncultured Aquitalea sp.]
MTERSGRLWLVIGPSGAGKDSLLAYARERMSHQAGPVFAHRYITRPADAGGENHIALSEADFARREQAGCFVLSWRRNGLAYGLGAEVGLWLERGLDVVANGSRAVLPQAVALFPQLRPLWITASPEVLATRLARRGREDAEAIRRRLLQAQAYAPPPGCLVLRNDGPLSEAGDALITLLAEGCLPAEANVW